MILVGKWFCLETGNWFARALAVGYAGGIVIQLTNRAPSFGKNEQCIYVAPRNPLLLSRLLLFIIAIPM